MPKTINPPHLRELEVMAGASNQVRQLQSGLTQVNGLVPVYQTTASRPKAPIEGQQIVNKQTGKLEIWYGKAWVSVATL